MHQNGQYTNLWQSAILGIVLTIVAHNALGDELGCQVPGASTDVPTTHPTCLFYTGTDHFRNERMAEAVESWLALLDLQSISAEYENFRIDALNNLGFMFFYGLGIEEDALAQPHRCVELLVIGIVELLRVDPDVD